MIRKFVALITVAMALAGCSTLKQMPRFDPAHYNQTHKAYDLTFFWNEKIENSSFIVDGAVKNSYLFPVNELEITVSLLDSQKNLLGKETVFVIPPMIGLDQIEQFAIRVPIKANAKPTVIRFNYYYHIRDDDKYGSTYYNSFESSLYRGVKQEIEKPIKPQ